MAFVCNRFGDSRAEGSRWRFARLRVQREQRLQCVDLRVALVGGFPESV